MTPHVMHIHRCLPIYVRASVVTVFSYLCTRMCVNFIYLSDIVPVACERPCVCAWMRACACHCVFATLTSRLYTQYSTQTNEYRLAYQMYWNYASEQMNDTSESGTSKLVDSTKRAVTIE